jgi:integrase
MHDLRRSYATYAKSAGINLDHIADLLGHASVKTTEKSYAFLKDDVKAEQGAKVSDELMKRIGS